MPRKVNRNTPEHKLHQPYSDIRHEISKGLYLIKNIHFSDFEKI